jgi:hypothetical protein
MRPLQNILRRYVDNTEVDPLKLTPPANLCALLIAAAICCIADPGVGLSRTLTPTPTVHDGQHDFDFNIGIRGTGGDRSGRAKRPPGLALFLYNPSAHQWSQSFANSKVGTLSSNIGEFKDGRVVLIGKDTVNDKTILVRAVWSDIKPESHQYEESYSNDGGTTWVRSFIAHLTRIG